MSQELKRLIQQDVIKLTESSEWVSPVVVTKEKDGNIRLCVDLREPNKTIVVDSFPLPHMEEMFAELRGSTVFSMLDLQSAYDQVLLHEDSRSLTSFITHEGLFRYKQVPYGLVSGPGCFQRLMSTILKGLVHVNCYLDDVIALGKTVEEHDKNLNAALQRLETAGLKLNFDKCHIRQTELSFLGHTILAEGLLLLMSMQSHKLHH